MNDCVLSPAIKQEVIQTNYPEQLKKIKPLFIDNIDSSRVYSRVDSLELLLHILDQRDCLQENTESLILTCSSAASLENKFSLEKSSILLKHNIYGFPNRNSDSPLVSQIYSCNKCLQPSELRKREAIFELVAVNIGQKWRELGRHLNIEEGRMDALDNRFPKDFQSKVIGLLKLSEAQEFHNFEQSIRRALIACRRSDLKSKIDEVVIRVN